MKLANIDNASWLLLLMLWVITPEIAEASVVRVVACPTKPGSPVCKIR